MRLPIFEYTWLNRSKSKKQVNERRAGLSISPKYGKQTCSSHLCLFGHVQLLGEIVQRVGSVTTILNLNFLRGLFFIFLCRLDLVVRVVHCILLILKLSSLVFVVFVFIATSQTCIFSPFDLPLKGHILTQSTFKRAAYFSLSFGLLPLLKPPSLPRVFPGPAL